ncbi:hypothetical protein AGMMS49545_23950 [Betaproteobacteria bacterium]|nr:hypothetical protein AGMMS49545_23950 [Betaproteobacteria bacterium]GHU49375.1 hypothetical protein AGMMS50289_26440 [Betaproteobacteria bacterium]
MNKKYLMFHTILVGINLFFTSIVFAAENSASLCSSTEKVFFSCHLRLVDDMWWYENNLSENTVSLCGSTDLTTSAGYLQIRSGQKGRISLLLPKELDKSQQKFTYREEFWSSQEGIREIVIFTNDGHFFDDKIYDNLPPDNFKIVLQYTPLPKGRYQKEYSFILSDNRSAKAQATNLACRQKGVVDNLEQLHNILPCDKGSQPEQGGCSPE